MGLVELFVLALGLSMDAFAVSICKGLSLGKIRKKHMVIAGLWFGGFQTLMPVVGYFLGRLFADKVAQYAHWIAFVLLVLSGVSMIKEAKEAAKEPCPNCSCTEEKDDSMAAGSMFVLAVATSIDAFAVGVTFAFLKVSIIPAVSFIGIVTFVCSALGIKIGSIFGAKYQSKAELFGGIILILIGIKTLLGGLGLS